MERDTDAALRSCMTDTLARAASAGGSPHTFRAAFRVLSSDGAVVAETAGPLESLRDPIAGLIGDVGATDEPAAGKERAVARQPSRASNASSGGRTLVCTVDPYAADLAVAVDNSSAAAVADAVAGAGIATVCVAAPSTSDFLEALRQRGVDVRTEVCAGEAILMNEAPIVAARRGSPFVHLVVIESVDGRALSTERAPAEATRLRADLGGGARAANPGAAKNATAAGGGELAEIISGTAWDRLTVITVPVVRGGGREVIGDLGIRDMSDVRILNNAAWWTLSDMVVLTGYRDCSETFGHRLARTIGDTAPQPLGLPGVEPVAAPGRGGGVLATLGYHRPNS